MSQDTTNAVHLALEEEEQYDFHCITCSDEALPAKVLSVDAALSTAQVEIGNSIEEVDVSLVDLVAPGDTLLVHGGVALSNLES